MKHYFLLLSAVLFCGISSAQTSLLDAVEDEEPKKELVTNAFKSSRVINGQSMEMISKGALEFRILHRFGPISDGFYQFFGLDQANMRIGFDYGITNNLSIGIGRSTFQKELDGFLKYRILHQSKGEKAMPVSVLALGGTTWNTLKWTNPARNNLFSSRFAYFVQTIVGRKFSDRLTIQVSPTWVHTNLVQDAADANDVFACGIGARFKVTRRLAITLDYFYNFNGYAQSVFFNPLSVGVDIETGGHVFQLHVSNTIGMNERAYITRTANDWTKGEIRFGFNISRMFYVN